MTCSIGKYISSTERWTYNMLSRDMKVQAGVVTLAILVGYVGENVLNIRAGDGSVSIPLLLLMYGIAFGGTHFYLAPRNYDDSVPVGT